MKSAGCGWNVAFAFNGMHFDEGLRVDLLVDGCLVIELKSVEKLAPVHAKQLLTYLRLQNLPVGFCLSTSVQRPSRKVSDGE